MNDWSGRAATSGNGRIGILADGDEAQLIEETLRAADIECERVEPVQLGRAIVSGDLAAAIITCEGVGPEEIEELRRAVDAQPPWSDFPFLLPVSREHATECSAKTAGFGHVTLVERPLDRAILLSAARAALRSRARQREAEAYLRQRETIEEHLRQLTATLETRVGDRMKELRATHDRLVAEAVERKAAEERLRESEELYRYTVELSQQIAWTADAGRTIVSVSPRFAAVTGIGEEVPPHDGWLSAVHPDDLPKVVSVWSSATDRGEVGVVKFRMRVADGSYRLFRARAAPHFDEEGRILRWYGYTEDIHDQQEADAARREAEARLRESEELHRYTLELSQQIVWAADPDGTFLGRSLRYNELTGLDEDTPPTLAIHPEDVTPMMAAWAQSVTTGETFLADYRLRMRDGSYRRFRSRAAARRDEAGRIVRWYGTSEDIHDQHLALEARRQAEERYQLAARATNDVIWDLDPVANQIEWSDAAALFFGYVRGSGPTSLSWWEDRVHPDDRERVSASLDRAVRGRRTHWAESYRFLNGEGDYADVYDRGFIIRDARGKAVRAVGAMSDITERRTAEAQLQRMQAELIHVSRVSAMGTMASTLAHELNQPLTAVASYVRGSRRLLRDHSDPTVRRVCEALEAAEGGALRAGQIVRGLRELVARGNVSVKSEELPRLIRDASVLAFVDQALLGVSHRIDLDPEAHWVDVDRIQIQQVLINLIRNAVQAMTDQPRREVMISARPAAGDMVEISIADTGIGLSPEVREALFSPFQSTKAEGMGIGLSISRTIVEAHGGKIWADNRKGGGAVFRFTLPRADEPGEEELDQPGAAAAE